MIGRYVNPPLFGPRNSVVRTVMGEDVPLDDWLTDSSEFIWSESLRYRDIVLESFP